MHLTIRHFLASTINHFGFASLNFALSIVTTQFLYPEDRGIYALFYLWAGLIYTCLGCSLYQANIYLGLKGDQNRAALLGNSILFCIAGTVLLAFVLVAMKNFTPTLLPAFLSSGYVVMLVVTIFCTIFMEYIGSFFMIGQRYTWYQGGNVGASAFIFLATLGSFVFADAHVEEAIAVRTLGLILAAVVFVRVLTRSRLIEGVGFDVTILKKQIVFGSKNTAQKIIALLNYKSYLLVIAAYLNMTDVGYFSVAILLAEFVRFLPDALGIVLLPELSRLKDRHAAGLLCVRVLQFVLVLSVVECLFLAAIMPVIIKIAFGSNYAIVAEIGDVIIAAAAIGVIYQLLTRYFTSQNKQKFVLYSGLVGLLFAIGLAITLVPLYGLRGAAWAYLISNSLTSGIMLVFFALDAPIKKRVLLDPSWMFVTIKQLCSGNWREAFRSPN